jgi:hypothetical protein
VVFLDFCTLSSSRPTRTGWPCCGPGGSVRAQGSRASPAPPSLNFKIAILASGRGERPTEAKEVGSEEEERGGSGLGIPIFYGRYYRTICDTTVNIDIKDIYSHYH